MLAPSQHTSAVAVEDAGLRQLPDGWVWTTIGSVTENFDGRRVPVKATDRAAMRGPYPYYGASGVIDSVNSYLFDGIYLLITEDGVPLSQSKGIAFIASGKFWVNNHAHVVKALGDIPLEYLKACANSANLQGYVTGTTRLKLTQAALNSILVPLAPLTEQHRIVAEIEKQFTRLDASVAALKRVQANLKRYRASVLKAACEGRLVPTEADLARAEGRDYESADLLLERIMAERRARWESQEKRRGKYKEPSAPDTSALPELPEGWVWATVGQLLTKSEYGTSVKCSYEAEGLPVLRIPNIVAGDINLTDIKYATRPVPIDAEAALAKGDVLMCRTNGSVSLVGKTAVVNTELVPYHSFASYLLRFRLIEAEIMPMWFHLYATSQLGRDFIEQNAASSAGQNNVSLSLIHTMPIPLPPLAEQHRIVAEVERRLSVIQQTEAAVEANLTRAERLRQSILKQAFSGKLVPQNPNDEPACVLLGRIRAEREEAEAAAKSQRKPRRRGSKSTRTARPKLSKAAR